MTLEYGSGRLSRNAVNYQSTSRNIQEQLISRCLYLMSYAVVPFRVMQRGQHFRTSWKHPWNWHFVIVYRRSAIVSGNDALVAWVPLPGEATLEAKSRELGGWDGLEHIHGCGKQKLLLWQSTVRLRIVTVCQPVLVPPFSQRFSQDLLLQTLQNIAIVMPAKGSRGWWLSPTGIVVLLESDIDGSPGGL